MEFRETRLGTPVHKGYSLPLKINLLLILAFIANMSFGLLTFVVFYKLELQRKDTITADTTQKAGGDKLCHFVKNGC